MKKILILICSLLYVLPVWAGIGTELRDTLINLDLAKKPDLKLLLCPLPGIKPASCPLPGTNFVVSREIGLNHRQQNKQLKEFQQNKKLKELQNKQLKKLQRPYKYFPEFFVISTSSFGGIECVFDLSDSNKFSAEKIEKYQKKLSKSAITELTTKAQITVSCLQDGSVKLVAEMMSSNRLRCNTTVHFNAIDQSTPNALVELKNGNIIVGHNDGRIMLLNPFDMKGTKDLSCKQLLLMLKIFHRLYSDHEEIVMHPEWYTIFKTFPQGFRDLSQHRIKLVKIDTLLSKRKRTEFDSAEEDQQQGPRNGYGEFHEDIA